MILVFSLFWFLVGALLAWLAARWSTVWPRWISLITLGIHLIPLLVLWVDYLGPSGASHQGPWLAQLNLPWIPQLGISFFLGMDGVSLLLVILSNFLGIMAVAASWDGIQYRVGFFHFNLLWILAAIVGVFLSLDLFLFYVFWEMMLVPLYFLIPLFPQAAFDFAPVAMALAVIGILYGAVVSVGQNDLTRLVAYTSISHMGFVLLGLFAWNQLALQGAVMVILAHGISTGALFILAGDLQDRMHTRDMDRMGGLWSTRPRMSGVALFFALASLGLPGLGNFVGEFLVLLGTYQVNSPMAVLATLGFIVSTIYSLWMIQRVFQGPNRAGWKLPDMTSREAAIMAAMIVIMVWLGLYPQPVLDTAAPALDHLQRTAITVEAMPPAPPTQAAQPALDEDRVVQPAPYQGGHR
jgi:NADH:ubiquinone oxidoreductase subunit 4 (subunit M)